MGDLISRSALIEDIEKRCSTISIDSELYKIVHGCIVGLVQTQPTAYSVDKVVVKLEEEREKAIHDYDYKVATGIKVATDIVKVGV